MAETSSWDFLRMARSWFWDRAKDSPTNRLVEMDVATGKELRVLASDPQADLWQNFATSFILLRDPRDRHVQAAAFDYMKPEWRAVDPAVTADLKYLASLQAGAFLVSSQDMSGSKWAVWYFTDNGPTSFYLYDRAAHKAELLFQDHPALTQYKLSEMRPLTIPARDGFKMVSYLTLPSGNPAKGLPLILSVHGGPWARDEWGFDPVGQMLANRGYAVLQVNYRASIINVPYMNAANGKIGTLTDDDLTDAVQWAIKEGSPIRSGLPSWEDRLAATLFCGRSLCIRISTLAGLMWWGLPIWPR